MKEDILFQTSIFGDFSKIDFSPNTMSNLLSISGKYNLIPMSFKELNVITQQFVTRPQFATQNNELIINFGTNRMDILANNIENLGIIKIDEFHDVVMKYIDDVFEYYKILANRISFISKSIIPIANPENESLKRNNLPIEFYEDKNNFEWSIRNVANIEIAFTKKDFKEDINVGTVISKTKLTKNNNGILKNFDTIVVDTDINTKAENSVPRFSNQDICDFLNQTIRMSNEIINQSEGVYHE